MKGKLYAVGVGPGDPELVTLKALRIIKESGVIAVPVTRGENMMAMDIVRGLVDFSQKEILPLEFLMSRDTALMEKRHQELTCALCAALDSGRQVALLTIGDVSVYSTASYLLDRVRQLGYETGVVAGVPSFCAVAAELQTSLTEMKKPLHIIPTAHEDLSEALALSGTKVFMKGKGAVGALKEALRTAGLYEKASMVENCGRSDQRVYQTLDDAPDDNGYFTTVVVRG